MMCICCSKKISPLFNEGKSEEKIVFGKEEKQTKEGDAFTLDASSEMWKNGVIGLISAGYGSSHDMDEFVISICDDCITLKKSTGHLAYLGNLYNFPNYKDYNNSKLAWRRYNLITDILSDD